MTTPNKTEIYSRALELYFQHEYRNGNHATINPEYSELLESGFISEAQTNLMMNPESLFGLGKIIKSKEEPKNVHVPLDKTIPLDTTEAMESGTFSSGTSGSGKTYLNFHIADQLMKEGVIVYVIDPSQKWQRLSSIPNVITITYPMKIVWQNGTTKQSTIFDVSFLTSPEKLEFTNAICKTILDSRKKSNYRPQTFIIFEEGQLYFPEGSMKGKNNDPAKEVVTNGRNYHIRYGVITQFPSLIDKTLIKMCKQRYFGWTNERNDVKYIAEIIGVDWAYKLRKLETGEFMYSYPTRTHDVSKIKTPMYVAKSTPKGT